MVCCINEKPISFDNYSVGQTFDNLREAQEAYQFLVKVIMNGGPIQPKTGQQWHEFRAVAVWVVKENNRLTPSICKCFCCCSTYFYAEKSGYYYRYAGEEVKGMWTSVINNSIVWSFQESSDTPCGGLLSA